ncbi:uncharacterized protein LOC118279544 [Spodoptera frugiperda]|uniref:Uncharacterized protein LOC118279544 n=1 Tax=Spodoptera frugiperda TaxID=7108 RepID=A0A9R0F1J9_SPOFR|nr:uncharacterized protein LOC118279544 [Spodoptera frugiperda]
MSHKNCQSLSSSRSNPISNTLSYLHFTWPFCKLKNKIQHVGSFGENFEPIWQECDEEFHQEWIQWWNPWREPSIRHPQPHAPHSELLLVRGHRYRGSVRRAMASDEQELNFVHSS